MRILTGLTIALLGTVAAPAFAAAILPTSYAMPNGSGQTSGGTFNYWDAGYSGTGATTTDGAPLSGGLGKLTDGVVSTSSWNLVSNNAGTGEYVGWRGSAVPNPLITFTFAGSPLIDTIAIQLDNSGIGGVFAPAAILIDGVVQSFTAPMLGTVGTVSFTGLGLTGGSHTIQFRQAAEDQWTFVSEISFDGAAAAVPEPAAWTLMIGGFGLVGGTLRRRARAALATT